MCHYTEGGNRTNGDQRDLFRFLQYNDQPLTQGLPLRLHDRRGCLFMAWKNTHQVVFPVLRESGDRDAVGAGELVLHTVPKIQQRPECQLTGRIALGQPFGVAGSALAVAANASGQYKPTEQVIHSILLPGIPEVKLTDQQRFIVIDQIQKIVRRDAGTVERVIHRGLLWVVQGVFGAR